MKRRVIPALVIVQLTVCPAKRRVERWGRREQKQVDFERAQMYKLGQCEQGGGLQRFAHAGLECGELCVDRPDQFIDCPRARAFGEEALLGKWVIFGEQPVYGAHLTLCSLEPKRAAVQPKT